MKFITESYNMDYMITMSHLCSVLTNSCINPHLVMLIMWEFHPFIHFTQ